MSETYRITFHLPRGRETSVDVEVPDSAEPLQYLANEIARELDLMRYEIQIGSAGGHIRLIGDDGPGTRFTLTQLDEEPDGAPCCPDPQCPGRRGDRACTFPGYADNH